MLRSAAQVVVVSPAFRPYVAAAGVPAERVHVVPNWTHVAPSTGDRAQVRRRLGWAEDEVVALHSGTWGSSRGWRTSSPRRGWHRRQSVVLMGDGSQRAVLEALGAGVDRLSFLPPADSADFPDVLAAADVLVVNERASAVDMSLPGKLTWYFSAGQPVVAVVPAGGGTAAEVARSGGGVLVPPEDPTALLAALEGLWGDPERRERLGTAGVVHAREELSAAGSLGRLTDRVLHAAER